jgi:hypothetical protein
MSSNTNTNTNTIYKIGLDAIDTVKIDKKDFQRLCFINNAINDGWSVKKRNQSYFFSKKIEGCEKVIAENYLDEFIISNNKFFSVK